MSSIPRLPTGMGGGGFRFSPDFPPLEATTRYGPNMELMTSLPREGIDIMPSLKAMGMMRMSPLRKPLAGLGKRTARPTPSSGGTEAAGRPGPTTTQHLAKPSMSPQGVLGTYGDAHDPLYKGPTGFLTDNTASNYLYSPTVNPERYGQKK